MIQAEFELSGIEELEALLSEFAAAGETWWYREKIDAKTLEKWENTVSLHTYDTAGRLFHQTGECRYFIKTNIYVTLTGDEAFLPNFLQEREGVTQQTIFVQKSEETKLSEKHAAPEAIQMNYYTFKEKNNSGYFLTV